MTASGCDAFGRELGPFLDGELDGTWMLRVSHHLDECEECTAAIEDMRAVGASLRDKVSADVPPEIFDGLASTVVTRVRAESAVSWRATLARGFEDWHWAIVGGGAVAATVVSTSLLSIMLAFGSSPQRDDSLSAMTTNMGEASGYLYVYVSLTGEADQGVIRLQVDNGLPAAPPLVSDLVVSREHEPVTEAELVALLQQLVMNSAGHVLPLERLWPEQRKAANALLDELSRLRLRRGANLGRSYQVHEMRLVTSVSAKSF